MREAIHRDIQEKLAAFQRASRPERPDLDALDDLAQAIIDAESAKDDHEPVDERGDLRSIKRKLYYQAVEPWTVKDLIGRTRRAESELEQLRQAVAEGSDHIRVALKALESRGAANARSRNSSRPPESEPTVHE